MMKRVTQKEAFKRGLPKWPQMAITGKPVSEEQAKRIIFKTERFSRIMQSKVGAVTGSFDPITKGHIYVIEEALKLVDVLYILVAVNPDKKSTFSFEERVRMIEQSVFEMSDSAPGKNFSGKRVYCRRLPDYKFAAKYASEIGASAIFRGLRNVVDFEYEHSIQMVNSQVASISTLFIMPPVDLIAVSSSMIKGMVGLEGWKKIAEQYVDSHVISALEERLLNVIKT